MADATIDVPAAAAELEGATAVDILRWASQRLAPKLTFATGFGAEGCVIIDLVAKHGLPIDLFTLDTGVLFPETYTLWKQLENKYGITIRGVTSALTLDEQAAAYGPKLWERDLDLYQQVSKVEPFNRATADFDGWITGRRRQQSQTRAELPIAGGSPQVKINPLADWNAADLLAYAEEHDLPPHPLVARGYPSIGCVPCTA